MIQLSLVTLCDPMNCSTPGFLVCHQLLELAQTHVYRVGDAMQPSYPLSSPSPPAFTLAFILLSYFIFKFLKIFCYFYYLVTLAFILLLLNFPVKLNTPYRVLRYGS